MSSRIISVWVFVLCLNLFDLTPAIGGGYQLQISHPDGSAFRQESVIEDADGNSQVEGEIRQVFSEPHGGSLAVFYKTGSVGYRVQFSFTKSSTPMLAKNGTFPIKRIGVNALKSTAG
ncbi:uncharacterized protein LOC108051299 [Drosophila rhopaloa]|uniref:Uncharacterized protein n=1 Tax=Drosophila rhopaloa TaxID=1041015 RepID=A0ABM5I217_DRORH|nr:uncharacterized protein LOC108051299 [Drosophila rhopaloa]